MLGEAGLLADWLRGGWRTLRTGPPTGGGRPVMVIPGFLAADMATAPLRRALTAAGYDVPGWGLGRNRGATATLLDAPIGWSLGGVYAREAAARAPRLVERVVTLGSPISGDPRADNAWRLYERIAGHPVDAPPIMRHPAARPPVPTIALWSRRDGIVAPASARGTDAESDLRVEVDCRHMGFVVEPAALGAVIAALAVTAR